MLGKSFLVGKVIILASTLPQYMIQSILLPKSIYNELDDITRQFLWGDSSESKKVDLVKWDSFCEDKLEGGLGLKPTSLVNEAYMVKLGWRNINPHYGAMSYMLNTAKALLVILQNHERATSHHSLKAFYRALRRSMHPFLEPMVMVYL